MRNIALLEWGPASLFHIYARERIKVRTGWLEGGPLMPPFLSTKEEAKACEPIPVRYALSAFEDLNAVVRNLRRCFGFPYQEAIGYLNTLTRTHRARREHESLVDRLRRWAIFGNVDAVVWIDYAKANQPPGEFKMGPRDSRPFNASHMEICTHIAGEYQDDDEESEAWSEVDDEGAAATTAASHGGGGAVQPDPVAQSATQVKAEMATTKRSSHWKRPSGYLELTAGLRTTQDKSKTPRTPKALGGASSPGDAVDSSRNVQEKAMLRMMIQEEVVPAHGSIYVRSIAPGPGHYGSPGPSALEDKACGMGYRAKSTFDQVAALTKDNPGPGKYEHKAPLTEEKALLGRFGKAVKMVPPDEATKKLPFISKMASKVEGHGLQSPNFYYSISPEAPCGSMVKSPQYTFAKARRPF
eukprot:gnl/TRDRNA2_/TRDRNA2_185575_c0_seq1.p1 gnl/TRDRNA2_/TRDRNA2_185575_c0~~gnl/TRDRNA2_/TRDRNA2_185575_c0_seq1.p1  ORF type:complete len:413 (+),score=63.72 gnl/TRDRNA2_/TRDRNA2_185575_c0_seq1:80-1318(+)